MIINMCDHQPRAYPPRTAGAGFLLCGRLIVETFDHRQDVAIAPCGHLGRELHRRWITPFANAAIPGSSADRDKLKHCLDARKTVGVQMFGFRHYRLPVLLRERMCWFYFVGYKGV